MMIAARNAFLMSGAKLPYDAEVEYLEGVSGGYIVLPWAFRVSDRWELEAQFTGINSYNGVYIPFRPAGESSSIERVDIARGGGYFRINYGPNNNVAPDDSSRHLFVLDAYSNNCRIDAATYPLPGTHVSVPDDKAFLGLLARLLVSADGLSGVNVEGVGCRVFSCRFYRLQSLGMDLIPVRVGSGTSAVGYLYDRANPDGGPLGNGLYPNAGTGAFVVGPDK